MTMDKAALIARVVSWQKAHPPVTGYAEKSIRQVCAAGLPIGTNLMTQFALQFTGREEATDVIHWDKPEWRLPYSNTYRYSLDRSVDCSSFWFVMYQIFFGLNIGTWTKPQWKILKGKQVPWASRRPCDLVYYNFKPDRTVSHVAGYIGDGLILHTTSPTNPLRAEADSYASTKRVGVVRALTDAQYQSLIVDAAWGEGSTADMIIYKDPRTDVVKRLQKILVALGYDLGTYGPAGDGVDGDYGTATKNAVAAFQSAAGVQTANIGLADDVTLLALAEATSKLGADPAKIAAAKAAFVTIADTATAAANALE